MGVTLHTYAHGELNWDTKLVPVSGSGGDSDLERIAAAINHGATPGPLDLNTLTTQGSYNVWGATNAPNGISDGLLVVVDSNLDASFIVQTAYRGVGTAAEAYRRYNLGGSWIAWRQIVDSANIQSIIGDTGWVTSSTGITAASGWTLNSSKYRIRNGLVEVGVNVTKNATAVTAGSNGSIANTPLVNLPALLVPTSANGTVSNVGATSTFSAQGYFSQSASQIVLTMANGGIPAGGVFDGYGFCYL